MAIYYLDVDDEITSAAQRIRESSEERVALVVQPGSRLASSRINFKLLAREARHHGRRLAIVASDASVRSLAEAAGLPVFGTVGEYQRADAVRPAADEEAGAAAPAAPRGGGSIRDRSGAAQASPGTRVTRTASSGKGAGTGAGPSAGAQAPRINPPLKPRRLSGRWIGVGIGAAAAVLVLAGYLLLPAASVVLTLRTESVGPVTFTALVDPAIASPNADSGVVPAVPQEFEVQAGGNFKATGENVLETAAIGKVTFSSANTVGEVPILAGTQVSTAKGVAFTTTANVTVPKATLEGLNLIPGTVDANVVAVTKGTGGNVAAGAIVKVPPDLAAFLVLANSVTNKEPTTGGTRTISLFIQQSDIDEAESELTRQLETAFEARLSDPAAAAAGMQLFRQGSRLGSAAFDPDPEALLGLEQERFDMTATGTGTALSATTLSLRQLAAARVAEAAGPGYGIVDGSVVLSIESSEAVGNAVSVTVTAQGLQAPAVDEAKIRAAIGGMSPADAEAYLARYGTAEVSVWPFWASTVPDFLEFRIEVRIVAPTPGPTPTPTPAAQGSSGATASPGSRATTESAP
jgi:hypothetical protein